MIAKNIKKFRAESGLDSAPRFCESQNFAESGIKSIKSLELDSAILAVLRFYESASLSELESWGLKWDSTFCKIQK